MSSAPIQRDLTTKTQAAVRRGAPGAQSGARKVVSRTNTDGVVPSAPDTAVSVPVGWATYYHLSQSVSGAATVTLDSLHDTEGDTSWLLDNGSGLTDWTLNDVGLYEIHVYVLASSDRPAGNCVEIRPILGFRFPGSGPVASIGFNGTGGALTNPRIACQTVMKTVTALEGAAVTVDFRYQGSATTISSYVTFVKVL